MFYPSFLQLFVVVDPEGPISKNDGNLTTGSPVVVLHLLSDPSRCKFIQSFFIFLGLRSDYGTPKPRKRSAFLRLLWSIPPLTTDLGHDEESLL